MRQTTRSSFDDPMTARRSLTVTVSYTPKIIGMNAITSHFCVRLAETLCDGLVSRQDIRCNHGRLFESTQKKATDVDFSGLKVMLNVSHPVKFHQVFVVQLLITNNGSKARKLKIEIPRQQLNTSETQSEPINPVLTTTYHGLLY